MLGTSGASTPPTITHTALLTGSHIVLEMKMLTNSFYDFLFLFSSLFLLTSLENIDYSICTLEFETRRESYYWVLEALNLYRPKVYEMSRLNITYTVLSKRKLLKLVNSGYMRGWDDPRMPTIKGLRRRGYTAAILNAFCQVNGMFT
jgi:hypothetical protein